MSLFIAILLNNSRKGIGVLRTLYYLPSLFGGSVAVATLWRIMFMDQGMVNAWINFFGFPTVSFLGNPKTALPTLSMLEVWQFGSSMVMFLAALKQVPAALYEAARIDGAGRVRSFFKITLPYISPILFFCIIMQTINALQNFTSVFVITRGGPLKSTYMLGLKLYNDGFVFWRMGYASATSWIIFLLVALFTLVLFSSQKYWVFYSDQS
jgi:oligogalacturonide transport system permease protein